MRTTGKSFFAGVKDDTARERTNRIAAKPATTSKLGPSGSLIRKKFARDSARDVRPKISSEVLLRWICIPLL